MSKGIGEHVRELIARQAVVDPGQALDDRRLVADFGFDSLDLIELVIAVEDEFAVDIDDQEAERCITVGDCIALVEKVLS
jgi:acyl carrier protein